MKHYIAAIIVALSLASCISDDIEPCPALHVTVGVLDKNYKNVDRVAEEQRRPDDLAFREYVPTLTYTLRDAKTGETVEEDVVDTSTGQSGQIELSFCPCVPHGRYVLTLYGATGATEQHTADGTLPLDHEADTYLASDTLDYDPWHNGQHIDMERAKGKLIIAVDNMPEGEYDAQMTVTRLAESVTPARRDEVTRFRYNGETTDQRTFTASAQPAKFILPPTQDTAQLSVTLTSAAGTLTPPTVTLNIDRNAITEVKYVYAPDTPDLFTIFVLINGSWEQVNNMDVE